MTDQQFNNQAERLISVFGPEKFNVTRLEVLKNGVKNLDYDWFVSVCDKAILSSNDRFNFLEAIQYEKNKKAMERRTNEIIQEHNLKDNQMTETGLAKVLNSFQANSLLDAIKNAAPKKS